jgi:hypothetical protein
LTKRPSFDKNYIVAELDKLSKVITAPIKIFIIGGLAMISQGLKDTTKDIDVVVLGGEDLRILIAGLTSIKYKPLEAPLVTQQYEKLETSRIMQNADGFRWDMFQGKICNRLSFSANMIRRATEFYTRGNVKIAIASKEDVFLFKGITEREADLNDMRLLAESQLDWQIIKEECRNQSDISGRIWEDALVQRLIDLREGYGIRSPIEKELRKICEEKMAEDIVMKSITNGKTTIKAISEATTLPEYYVRQLVRKLEKKKLVTIDVRKRQHAISLVR